MTITKQDREFVSRLAHDIFDAQPDLDPADYQRLFNGCAELPNVGLQDCRKIAQRLGITAHDKQIRRVREDVLVARMRWANGLDCKGE